MSLLFNEAEVLAEAKSEDERVTVAVYERHCIICTGRNDSNNYVVGQERD